MSIKLSKLLPEHILQERNFDLSKKEEAAEYVIGQVWRFIPQGEDRYNINSVLLWLSNESELNAQAEEIAKQFYPDSSEPLYDFHDDIEQKLQKMEMKRLERRRKQTPSLKDPLYILRKLIVGKSWNQTKGAIARMLPGRAGHTTISDEDPNVVFNRLYKNAMGETVYDKEEIEMWGYGRLSDLTVLETSSDENHKQYTVNIFLRHYFSGKQPVGKVKVWRGTNNPHAPIRPGDFVTFDRGYSQGYMSGKWKAVVTDLIDAKDLITYKLDPGMSEFVYWPEGHQIQKYEGEVPTLRDFWSQYRFGL